MSTKPLIEAPASDSSATRETLGYIEAYDAVLNGDYAFAVYKETSRDSGETCLRIASRGLTGVVFQPEQMRLQARTAGAQGKPYFTWGQGISPSAGDARHIEYRVRVKNGQPEALEIFVQVRKFDQTADEAKTLVVPWPKA